MFSDKRSKKLVFLAHCILNQNSISDGTAEFPASINELIDFFQENEISMVQMPCPELLCLGLDRGNKKGAKQEVIIENTRIRESLKRPALICNISEMAKQLVFQIEEYQKHEFEIIGLVGINRSPSCGVNTTSKNNVEVEGQGIFISILQELLKKRNIKLKMIGIKGTAPQQMLENVKNGLAISV